MFCLRVCASCACLVPTKPEDTRSLELKVRTVLSLQVGAEETNREPSARASALTDEPSLQSRPLFFFFF